MSRLLNDYLRSIEGELTRAITTEIDLRVRTIIQEEKKQSYNDGYKTGKDHSKLSQANTPWFEAEEKDLISSFEGFLLQQSYVHQRSGVVIREHIRRLIREGKVKCQS